MSIEGKGHRLSLFSSIVFKEHKYFFNGSKIMAEARPGPFFGSSALSPLAVAGDPGGMNKLWTPPLPSYNSRLSIRPVFHHEIRVSPFSLGRKRPKVLRER